MTSKHLLALVVGNALVIVSFCVFLLLARWMPAVANFYVKGRFLPAFCYVGFFTASFLSLRTIDKKAALIASFAIALALCGVLLLIVGFSAAFGEAAF